MWYDDGDIDRCCCCKQVQCFGKTSVCLVFYFACSVGASHLAACVEAVVVVVVVVEIIILLVIVVVVVVTVVACCHRHHHHHHQSS